MKTLLTRCLLLGLLCSPAARADDVPDSAQGSGSSVLDSWADSERAAALTGLLNNISPRGAAAGAVVASPSRQNPNYFYHWVRDAALVMSHVVDRYAVATDMAEHQLYDGILWDYINFSRGNQMTPNRSGGLGEPKFNADGSAFNGDWGRPQNDGPALRALTLIKFANLLLANGGEAAVRDRLYDSKIPATGVIKADLEFVSHHWREKNFDVWEEVYGTHFYNLLVYRSAMLKGAALADALQDAGAAAWYRQQASAMASEATKHWRADLGYVEVTHDREAGIDYKSSGLDTVTILAALHADIGDGFFDAADDRILATAQKIESVFANIYPINQNRNLGTAIGRYPEDRYDGYRTDRDGNPWFLATLAFAELHYRLYQKLEARGQFAVNDINVKFLRSLYSSKSLPSFVASGSLISKTTDAEEFAALLAAIKSKGDNFMRRVRQHVAVSGNMDEQFSRNNGYMQGATDLTWSYAAFLTADRYRPVAPWAAGSHHH